MENGISKNAIISELTKSPHGDLKEYAATTQRAALEEPAFLAHLIAWDRLKGQIRDAKVALPVLSLVPGLDEELADNSLAHIAMLNPREFLRAYRFAREMQVHGRIRIRRLTGRYLRNLESNWFKWERVAVQHRHSLKEVYSLARIGCSPEISNILWGGVRGGEAVGYRKGSIFETISLLGKMDPIEAAGSIMNLKIPFQIALGALGAKAQHPDLLMALVKNMTPTQLVTNMKMLERFGIRKLPALRGALDAALANAGSAKQTAATLKTSKAVEAVEDEELKERLRSLQEKQIAKIATVDGDWLVLGDKSPSMQACIEGARQVAATLAKMVKGKVHLVFFDSHPLYVDVTGLTLEQIHAATKHVAIGNGTSIGCGIQLMIDNKLPVNGIAIVSDAQENTTPFFVERLVAYRKMFDIDPPVYLYRFQGSMPVASDIDLAHTMKRIGTDLIEFDLRGGVDYYSLPNLVQTMRVKRYSLFEEIMGTNLLRVDQVLKYEEKKGVHIAATN